MFFNVNSQNRLAVRKLLTASGIDSTAVRVMRNGELGQKLFDLVQAGRLSEQLATATCSTVSPVPDVEPTPERSQIIAEPQPVTTTGGPMVVGAQLPADAAAALRLLLGVEAPKIDEAAMRRIAAKLVREEMVAAGQRPAVIEIRTESGKLGEVKGASTHKAFPDVVTIVSTRVQGRRLHAMLVGPSGSGKTYMSEQVAGAIKLDYYCTGAVLSKYDLIGFVPPDFNGESGNCPSLRTPFRNAYENGGVFLWDEVDGSDPRALVAFNQALDNGFFAFPDKCVKQHPDFVCIASANTWGTGATADYVGRNKLDAAFLKRFIRVEIDYDETLERDLVGPEHADWARFVQGVRRAVRVEGVKVLVTPRDTLKGAALLQAGMTRDKVEAMTIFAGLDSDTTARLRKAA